MLNCYKKRKLGKNSINYKQKKSLFPSFFILSSIFLISSAFVAFSLVLLVIHL